jgi:hypothetical protein
VTRALRRQMSHRRANKLNNPSLQAEGFSICRLEVDSCFRHSGFIVTWIPFSNGMTDAVRHLDAEGSLS